MRWTVVCLLLINVVFFLWNWLGYSHARNISTMNAGVSRDLVEMPGSRLLLLKERVSPSVGNGREVLAEPSNPASVSPGLVAPEAAATPVSEVELPDGCLLLGPLMDNLSAKVLIDNLTSLQIPAKYAEIEVEGQPDYWVYLPPEPTREMAVNRLRELQDKKIDSFIVPDGDIANGISLGVFDKRENAEKRLLEISEMGYEAKLRMNPRKYLEHWVVIFPPDTSRFSPELYAEMRAENNKLDMRKDPCNKVASILDIQ